MAYHLMPWDREQGYLMPPSLQEWLPEGDLAWFILDVVEQMDLREFYGAYREDGWGAAAYDPGMMVGILLLAYCQGVRSSRRIAWALERDVGFRVVAANQQPDFRTICRFRAEHEEALEQLFVQVLRLCREAGLVKLGVVALDGTKVAANAALSANRSYATIEEEVRRMLAEAKRVDTEEDLLFGPEGRGDELPQGLGRRSERLRRLQETKARLEEESARAAQAAQEHLARRQAEEAVQGQKKRGRKPKMVEPTPPGEAKANVTDPDSRVMKTRQGYLQGYNVQAVVSEDQIIVAIAVTQEANDVQQLLPMLEQMNQNLAAAGIAERPGVAWPMRGTGARPICWPAAGRTYRSWWWPPPKTGSNERQRGNGAVPEDVFLKTWACGSGWSASCSRNGGGPSTKSEGCWWSRCLAR